MQCYKVAKLQDLIVAEYYTYSFSADFIPIPSYYISVLMICYIPSAEYFTHMQCSQVAKLQHLIAGEYVVAQCSTE